ncbi:hypothetical protein [Microbacterium timonense]|uniref:hypothetical protein n=1 Tax=Microbacterium timonense TaxID=2086576 RepID=UPI001358BF88|nr:hypothetical protein [Microbacterium timonense]
MIEDSKGRTDKQRPPRSGWWWKLVALFLAVPPITVYAAEDEVEQERASRKD